MFGKVGSFLAVIFLGCSVFAQQPASVPQDNVVLWESVEIPTRDLYLGPGENLQPEFKGLRYIGRQPGGNNVKYRLKDGNGVEWIAKAADESQPEIAATRLLWAIGYRTEIDYLAPKFAIDKVGSHKNVRFEARPANIKRGERWSWTDNPFLKKKEFDGLKILMALVNNWDLKDENTVILKEGDRSYYVVSDLGASFGKLADKSMSRAGRSVNDADDYAKSQFIKGVDSGFILFHYNGMNEDLLRGITVENARWMADLLLQLSDKQIDDAFRAANYKPEEIQIYSSALKARIKALDEATKPSM
jgi:hypothetical protein